MCTLPLRFNKLAILYNLDYIISGSEFGKVPDNFIMDDVDCGGSEKPYGTVIIINMIIVALEKELVLYVLTHFVSVDLGLL